MKLCFPVIHDAGAATLLYGHFASAPQFLVIDTEGSYRAVIPNCDRTNPGAGCSPFSALRGRELDAIIVDAIGDDAVGAMNLCGFRVYLAGSRSVIENLALFEAGGLTEVALQNSHLEGRCSAGEKGNSCGHHHH